MIERYVVFFFYKQKTAYEVGISDWSSDVCSSDLVDAETARDVARWRKAARERLFATRRTIPGDERRAVAQLIAQGLDRIVANLSDPVVSVYWPIRDELNLIPWRRGLVERGITIGRAWWREKGGKYG